MSADTQTKRKPQSPRKGLHSLTDPNVREDVEFLIALGRPNDEIAARCSVGITALEKRYGKRNAMGS